MAWMRQRYSEHLVFVMCTALSQLEATKLAAVARAEGCLCKPYTMKDLLDLLSNLRSTWHSCAPGSEPVVEAVALADSKARAQSQNDLRTAQGMFDARLTLFCMVCNTLCCSCLASEQGAMRHWVATWSAGFGSPASQA